MTLWLITFDDATTEAATARDAVEQRIDEDSIPTGATVFAINLDAIVGTENCHRFRIGAEHISETAEIPT